jgi:DNA-binding XRE family transcriptional regulator
MTKIDATIGQSIRHYRWLHGIEQTELAAAVGVTPAQLRSHEAGKSRVSAALLFAIATHLGVEVQVFFQRSQTPPAAAPRSQTPAARGGAETLSNAKYLAAMMTHFQRLSDAQKQAVLHLVLSISKDSTCVVPLAASHRPAHSPCEMATALAGPSHKDVSDGFN